MSGHSARERAESWPPPWDSMDPPIVPVVRALVEAGFVTLASCGGHETNDPWVIFDGRGVDPIAEACRIADWLVAQGAGGFWIAVKWWTAPSGSSYPSMEDPYIEVTWWARDGIQVFGR